MIYTLILGNLDNFNQYPHYQDALLKLASSIIIFLIALNQNLDLMIVYKNQICLR